MFGRSVTQECLSYKAFPKGVLQKESPTEVAPQQEQVQRHEGATWKAAGRDSAAKCKAFLG